MGQAIACIWKFGGIWGILSLIESYQLELGCYSGILFINPVGFLLKLLT